MFIILVPARDGAPPNAKFYVAGLALTGIGWGIGQILAARREDRRESRAASRARKKNEIETIGSPRGNSGTPPGDENANARPPSAK